MCSMDGTRGLFDPMGALAPSLNIPTDGDIPGANDGAGWWGGATVEVRVECVVWLDGRLLAFSTTAESTDFCLFPRRKPVLTLTEGVGVLGRRQASSKCSCSEMEKDLCWVRKCCLCQR